MRSIVLRRRAVNTRGVLQVALARLADMKRSSEDRPVLTTGTSILYGVGSAAFGVHLSSLTSLLLLFFNQVVGLPAAWVGGVMMGALVLDAICDPLIGEWSDHTRSRWGRRHPFMYASAVPLAVAFYFLWNPPLGWSHRSLSIYLIVSLVAVRLLLSLYEIPSQALGPELTSDYDRRTSLMSWRFLFGVIGGSSIVFLALRVFLRKDATHPLGMANRAGYGEWALVASVVMFASIMISCLGTHRFIAGLVHEPKRQQSWARKFREVTTTLSNRSFLSLMVSVIFGAVSLGMSGALVLYFNNYFWELSPAQLSYFQPVELVGALLAIVLAPLLSRRFGKKHAMMTLFVVSTVFGNGPIVLRLMALMPANHSPALLPILLSTYLVTYSLGITGFILITSMMADVVEDAAIVTGQRSEGLLFAANGLISKCVTGVGTLLSGFLLAAIGFPQRAIQGSVGPLILRNLGLVYVPIAASCSLISIAVLIFYNINRSTHEHNVERLGMNVEPAA